MIQLKWGMSQFRQLKFQMLNKNWNNDLGEDDAESVEAIRDDAVEIEDDPVEMGADPVEMEYDPVEMGDEPVPPVEVGE